MYKSPILPRSKHNLRHSVNTSEATRYELGVLGLNITLALFTCLIIQRLVAVETDYVISHLHGGMWPVITRSLIPVVNLSCGLCRPYFTSSDSRASAPHRYRFFLFRAVVLHHPTM